MTKETARDAGAHFQWFVCKMLLTFFAVAAVDVVALSLFTRTLRVWFPVWFDPQWSTRAHPWVVYSQSYFAGIFFIPLLAWAIDRDLLKSRVGTGARGAFWAVLVGTFAFILWWKGGLMMRYGKQWETAAWLALTTAIWTVISVAERLPQWLEGMTPRRMARGLARGVSTFFLVMAVLDPTMQIGVQKLAWSSGLLVEVGFFVPAGLVLMVVASRLREPTPKTAEGEAAVRAAE
jgi:hypothetical protein